MRFLYTILAYLLAPIFSAVLLWRGFRFRGYWSHFGDRLGFGRRFDERTLWVHAVSVGEMQAAAPLVQTLREHYPGTPIVVSTVTPTGYAQACKLFRDGVHVRYVPLDVPGAVRRFFDRTKPRLAVIFETELWPNLFHRCGRLGIPLVLASARISPRSVRRYRLMVKLFEETLSHGIVIAAQSEGDAARFRSIGANPRRTHVTGNIKFDYRLPPETREHGRALRAQHAAGRPVWIAGSVHEGEEHAMLAAHRRVLAAHPDALFVLVPRQPAEFDLFADLLRAEGVPFVRRSEGGICTRDTQVLLVDTLGELLDFYAASDVAFVGGSLVTIGGHNLLEPAALGVPVLTGPHNFNSEDVARLLTERGGAAIVADGEALGRHVAELLADTAERERMGGLAREVVDQNRGALARLLCLIEPLLEGKVLREVPVLR